MTYPRGRTRTIIHSLVDFNPPEALGQETFANEPVLLFAKVS
jgi:hypothetical protein